jgi:Tat protein secretion system quality control protein TatD with DNase activity
MIRFEQDAHDYDGVVLPHTLIEIDDASDITQLANAVRSFALAIGFHPENVRDAFGDIE